MKVILHGSTGFIGASVLSQCLAHPSITSIIALSRHPLPVHPKLTVVLLENFKSYPDEVLEQLRGADACIWSIGTYNWDPVVELDYPAAFQNALLKVIDGKKSFNYVYLGGAFTEPDQEKSLWFFSEGRRVRGLAQTQLLEFGEKNKNVNIFVVRPGGVLKEGVVGSATNAVLGWALPVVEVKILGEAMVDLAFNGGKEVMVENKEIVERGKRVLSAR